LVSKEIGRLAVLIEAGILHGTGVKARLTFEFIAQGHAV